MKKEKENEVKNSSKVGKILHIIGNILYTIIFIVVVLMLVVVVLQRASNNTVALGGYRIFTVATGSMIPKYEVSDVLIAKEIEPSEIKEGDDVVYKGEVGSFKDRVVTHQVISAKEEDGKYKFITKGIANTEADPEITQDQVYGKIVYKVKSLSWIGKVISNIYVFYFIVFIPIALIIFKQIKNIASKDEDDDEEDDSNDSDNDNKEDNARDKKNNKEKENKSKKAEEEKNEGDK